MPAVPEEQKTAKLSNATLSLRLKDIETGYAGFSIQHITFELIPGDIFGLLGRSGSGKSTIINTIVGLLPPKQGKITVETESLSSTKKKDTTEEEETELPVRRYDATAREELVGYSPQKNALYPFLTIEENIITFGNLYNVPRLTIDNRMEKILDRLDLTAHKQKRIAELSGGMEKRVDLAVTLIHDPNIIVLDEPFNGLDISLQRFIWQLLQELAAEGKIIVITSHLLDDIQRYCTKFGLVENGRFYGNDELRAAVQRQQGASLQSFLEQLFKRDLLLDTNLQKKKTATAK